MQNLRAKIRAASFIRDEEALKDLLPLASCQTDRTKIARHATEMVTQLRKSAHPSVMELFLMEYGLSSEEGVALMCLAEALLRVPDGTTIDALIEDKIAPSQWRKHLGESPSKFINASSWALFFTGKVLSVPEQGIASLLRVAVKRLGEPVIRQAVAHLMREMGQQFVLGETIQGALKRARKARASTVYHSYDMLGEAAMHEQDARAYHMAYADAIAQIAKAATSSDPRLNPGLSIKLSALHPNYDPLHRQQVLSELAPRLLSLAVLAKSANIGMNIDAEEAARLDLSLDVIERVLSNPSLADWDGFGVVVQAYGKRAAFVIDWLYALSKHLNRRIMVRLVKGAYWDSEIKLAQAEGLPGFPVYSAKHHTDISFICCAAKLFDMSDRIYPQFATHNAHTIAAILHLAQKKHVTDFEFQRLHGMGEALHLQVTNTFGTPCRVYAPVGQHRDLLAYLVRRLLENGANSSFVNQIFDASVASRLVAADPFDKLGMSGPALKHPQDLFAPERQNSTGYDLSNPDLLERLQSARTTPGRWSFGQEGAIRQVHNPATGKSLGQVRFLSPEQTQEKINAAQPWGVASRERATILRRTADLFEDHAEEFFALLTQEAGKTLPDCIGELRETVDFLRYYACQSEVLSDAEAGVFTCISPWNFPLAIFTGQIAAALAAGNAVLAKPAESTSMIAYFATELMHKAGVPAAALHLLAGDGPKLGACLCSSDKVTGVCFTGSTKTAQTINRLMARHLPPHIPLIAETGGLNAMIVDSTALLEQAVRDVIISAFQSAGQRCSALRMLYVQQDIAGAFKNMLFGAMRALCIGDPAEASCDIGPVIDQASQEKITRYIQESHVLFAASVPETGCFVAPTVLSVAGIQDLPEEIFGPVLHFASFDIKDLDRVIRDINGCGFGLTFGFHSRIDERVQRVIAQIDVGNLYINRNQIGAVVGSQPFGGHGLSGTGPKAGGPHYVARFAKQTLLKSATSKPPKMNAAQVARAFQHQEQTAFSGSKPINLPGPTGELNQYHLTPRQRVLCLGPGAEQLAKRALALGCCAIAADISSQDLSAVPQLDAVVYSGPDGRHIRKALSTRDGAIVPLLMDETFETWLMKERSVCIDTTAAGGNTALLAS
jgi:RHH-type proline utilization regulon transcriptional repressor/proline dehydrogenase/delta 1-pyrroline-5-carboxylate dehydrogenase